MSFHDNEKMTDVDILNQRFDMKQRYLIITSCFAKRWVAGFYKDLYGNNKFNGPDAVVSHWLEVNWIPVPYYNYILYYMTGKTVNLEKIVGGLNSKIITMAINLLEKRGYIAQLLNPPKRPFHQAVTDAFAASKLILMRVFYYGIRLKIDASFFNVKTDVSDMPLCSANVEYPMLGCYDPAKETVAAIAFKRTAYKIITSSPSVHVRKKEYLGMMSDGSLVPIDSSVLDKFESDVTDRKPSTMTYRPINFSEINDNMTKALDAYVEGSFGYNFPPKPPEELLR
jgi:hypothetical protein